MGPSIRLEDRRANRVPSELDDEALIAAIPKSGITDGPALAAEAGRRALGAAVPALERLCRRFSGFGVQHQVPEQVAALRALAAIGGGEAAAAVARLIAASAVQGPTLKVAAIAAARLHANLPPEVALSLLRHADPGVRAAACRCARPSPSLLPVLVDLIDDLNPAVSTAAACALGRLGRTEARPALLRLLHSAPTPEVIDALSQVADEDAIILLGRICDTHPSLAGAALDALDAIDHPRATQVTVTVVGRKQ